MQSIHIEYEKTSIRKNTNKNQTAIANATSTKSEYVPRNCDQLISFRLSKTQLFHSARAHVVAMNFVRQFCYNCRSYCPTIGFPI